MPDKYIVPSLEGNHFTCPHCGILAEQKKSVNYLVQNGGQSAFYFAAGSGGLSYKLTATTCQSCNNIHIWLDGKIIYPIISSIPPAIEEMPDNIKNIYNEAKGVYPHSPKAAAALLRLAVQHLCIHLGESGENINNDIKKLVDKGLEPSIQKALDIIRVTGNNAVHPGTMDLDDNNDAASSLFELLNFIVEQMISRPKKISEMFAKLPEGAKAAIEKRNGK